MSMWVFFQNYLLLHESSSTFQKHIPSPNTISRRHLPPEYFMTPEELGVLTINLLQDQEVQRLPIARVTRKQPSMPD
jgi:hypothetical protein